MLRRRGFSLFLAFSTKEFKKNDRLNGLLLDRRSGYKKVGARIAAHANL